MSYRYMRVLVFFDLPTLTAINRREYRRFRRFLIKNGFIMLQESVYSKLALNQKVASAVITHVRMNKPNEGLVQLLSLTEKQYSNIEFVVGESNSSIIDSDERLIIL